MSLQLQTKLSDEQILLLVELSLINQMGLWRSVIASETLPQYFLSSSIAEAIRETLRSLLREPLRDPEFRREFNQHFNNHPIPEIRTIGWEWLLKQLVWES